MRLTPGNDYRPRSTGPDDLKDVRRRMGDSLKARLTWFAGHEPATRALQTGSLTYTDCGLPSDVMNVVWGVPDSPADVKMVSRHYAVRRFPATWWLPTDESAMAAWWLAADGWIIRDLLIGMAFKPGENLKKRFELPDGLTVRPCLTPERVRDLGLVQGSVFMKDRPREGGIIYNAYEQCAEAIIEGDGGYRAWVAYAGETPVSSVVMIRRGRHFGMYDLTTHPDYRHLDYAQATFLYALDEIWSSGGELVTLQAAAKGVDIYSRLGFSPVTQFVLWTNLAGL